MVEEALLVGFEGRSRGSLGVAVQGAFGTGDVGRLERRLDVLVDDLEGIGVRIVDRDLLRRQVMLDDLVDDPLVGERAGGVETERLEVARNHLHRRDAARRSEEHTSELQSLMRISYAVFCLKKKKDKPKEERPPEHK